MCGFYPAHSIIAACSAEGPADASTQVSGINVGFAETSREMSATRDAQSQSIVENCGCTLILRCSASERGGTAEFASRLIGQRQIVRKQKSTSRTGWRFLWKTHTVSDQLFTEDAVMASEIEQLPDLDGFLKLPSQPQWYRVTLKRTDQ